MRRPQPQQERVALSAEDLGLALANVGNAVTIQDVAGRLLYANAQAAELLGYPSVEELLETEVGEVMQSFEVVNLSGEPVGAPQLPRAAATRSGHTETLTVEFRVRQTGQRRASEVRSTPVRGPDGEVRFIVNLVHDVTERRRAERSARFLAEASRLLAESTTDYAKTLSAVANLAVPGFADWSVVDLLEDDVPRRVAVAHVDPAKLALAAELDRLYPARHDESNSVFRAIRTGQSQSMANIPDEAIARTARDERHLALLRALGMRSYLTVPIATRGERLGAITFIWTESGRTEGSADLGLAEELGRRAAIAIENARLYEAQRRSLARLTDLKEISSALGAAQDVATVAQATVRLGSGAVGALSAALWLRAADGALELATSWRVPEAFVAPYSRLQPGSDAPAVEILRTGEARWVETEADYRSRAPGQAEAANAAGRLNAFAALPLEIDGRREGVLSFSFPAPHRFTADEKGLLTTLAFQSAQAIDRARLREAEGRQRSELLSLFRQAPAAIAVLRGPAHVFELANPHYQQIVGRSEQELLGRPIREAVQGVPGEGAVGLLETVWRTGEPVVAHGAPFTPVRDGAGAAPGYFTFVIQPWNGVHGREGLFIFAFEVTPQVLARQQEEAARRQIAEVEERLRLAVDAGQIGTWEYDPRSRRISLDAQARRLIGASSASGSTFAELMARVSPEHRARIEASLAQALDPAGSGRFAEELELTGEDGAVRWLSSSGRAKFEAGQAVEVIGTCIDITASKLGAARLEEAAQLARSAEQRKDEFLAMLGHELRNPLAPIVTSLQLMKLRGGARPSREQEVIERQVAHMVRLVDDLLDVARIARGKVQLHRSALELGAVVARAIETAAPLLEQREHHLSVKVTPGMVVEGDEARLVQVITNLVTNAAKYTEPGGNLWVSAERERDQAVITVRDDGAGIDAELLPHLFELFVQGRRSAARSEGGLGLGLTLVRNLVTLHGGTVLAESEGPGRGSTFTVRLPCLRVEVPAVKPGAAVVPPQALAEEALRILVVDDNIDAATALGELLGLAGHKITVAHDATEALRAIDSAGFDVGILDIGLPVMDGYELATQLRERLGAGAPRLIALTGYGQAKDKARSAEVGFAEHLVKPISLGELLAAIGRARAAGA